MIKSTLHINAPRDKVFAVLTDYSRYREWFPGCEPARTLTFRMVRGRDLRSYSGSYRLADSADGRGTVLVAEMRIELNTMVPGFIVNHFARKSIDQTGTSLKSHLARVASLARTNRPGLSIAAEA
jgi:ribosome-associated toxin RatA of RatAB toxin-antitoxin module